MYENCKPSLPSALSACAESNGHLRRFVLEASSRRLVGVNAESLLSGEFALLAYLGASAQSWRSINRIAESVYGRTDPAARELVWKYASTLRRKLSASLPTLIETCRRRGYRCMAEVYVPLDHVLGAVPLASTLQRNADASVQKGATLGTKTRVAARLRG
jgi:DNA-binding winged helix-turn-helix (wHTH) protein